MQGLADAARSRSEADWLVGINGTRAMTAFNSRDGGFFLTTVGRVQTPTLSIVVEREEKIRKHVARDYWEIKATFDAAGRRSTTASGSTRPSRRTDDPDRRADRVWNEADAPRRSPPRCAASPATVTEEAKPSTVGQPAAVRPDQPAARGQRPLRLLGQDHAVARAGAVREAQGADLSADRLARAARGLPAGGQGHAQDALDGRPARARCARSAPHAREGAQGRLRQADQAHLRQRQGLGSLRDHPDAAGAQVAVRHRGQALRPGRQALHRGVLPERRVPGHDAPRPQVDGKTPLPDQRQGAGEARAGSPSTARRRRTTTPTLVAVQQGEIVRNEAVDGRRLEDAAAGALHRRRRCCRRWKARAS